MSYQLISRNSQVLDPGLRGPYLHILAIPKMPACFILFNLIQFSSLNHCVYCFILCAYNTPIHIRAHTDPHTGDGATKPPDSIKFVFNFIFKIFILTIVTVVKQIYRIIR